VQSAHIRRRARAKARRAAPDPGSTENNADKLAQELNEAHYHIERNANPKMVFVDSSIQIAQYLRNAN
jgi:hypothetical protein